MFRRRGRPGLLGTVARTAVVAGTASATANAVNRHAVQKDAEQQAYADQQAPPAPQPSAPPAGPAAPAGEDLVGKINQLAQLRDAGVLSDDEFTAAKGKLLGI